MRQINIVILSLFAFGINYGQDLIVTKSNDSIKCKITKVKSKYIYFTYKKNNTYENTLISRNEVNEFHYDIFKGQEIPKDSIPGYEKYPRHLFGFNAGLSYDPGKRDPSFLSGFDDYASELRLGYNIGADYTYYFDKTLGIGIMANYFATNANQNDVPGNDGFGNPIVSDLSNEIRVLFIGPSFALRFMNKTQKNAFIWNTSFGYIDYQDNYFYAEEAITTGNGFGTVSSFGYNIGIQENLSIGVQLNLVASYFRTIEIERNDSFTEIELPRNNRPVGSSRLDFSLGLRYQL